MRRAFIFLFLMLLLAAGGAAAWLWAALNKPFQDFPRAGVFVTVPRRASGRAVGRILAKHGVVRSALAFELLSRRHPRRNLKAGEYFFSQAVTAREVFDAIANGRIYEASVTIPEGYTMFDIAQLLEQQGLVSRDDFLDAARDPSPILDLAPQVRTLEGFLFPATYPFPRHPAAKDVAAAMVRRFREVWQRLSPAGDSGGRSPGQIVTLASLVERETPVPAERPIVAGVFSNRLRKGQALQCDPTVAYALALAGEYRGTLRGADLRFDSPYNTYRRPGLPPGPIANPGEASLKAALEPASVDYYYFVANTQGGHFFSRTLNEHNRNVTRYRQLLTRNGQAQDSEPILQEPRAAPPLPDRPSKRMRHRKNKHDPERAPHKEKNDSRNSARPARTKIHASRG